VNRGDQSMSFFERVAQRSSAADTLLCVGLDPHPELLDENSAAGALKFCKRIIEATAELVCAFKPNSAFFEAYGAEGFAVLKEVIALVPDGIPVILDVKRGDISSTAQAYVRAAFDHLGADAVTASPYMGRDSLATILEDPQRGAFMLCKTSNPGSEDLQTLVLENGDQLYIHLARLGENWNQADNLGLVVGATDPRALRAVRHAAPDLWLLAPGVGAQGGDLDQALRAGLRLDGMGMIIPVSRGIARATDPKAEALRLRDEINLARRRVQAQEQPISSSINGDLADGLLEAGCVRFGRFKLKSGIESPIYIDLRRLASFPRLLSQAARAYQDRLVDLTFDRLAALPYAAMPIGTAISLQAAIPMVYPRKEVKAYGTKAVVEGIYKAGETVVVIDDLATTGGSKFEAIDRLSEVDLAVRDVVVLIDRESGARESLFQAGYRMHAVFTLSERLDYWEQTGKIAADQITEVRAFLESQAG
jgi:uridine monophosphate synthetase